ncbi:MAG: type II toxin-antitoxin system VapC family toxin [Hyphomicrobiales bacterium]|nr:type II toxin-antitoxin system VapC family toxin [Hyphomicrobiales bacterium]
MSLVLDSSAALAWIFDDEATEPIARVFDAVAEQGAFVPSLWRLEIANSLTVAVRRGRVGQEFRRAALADLRDLDIIVDAQTDSRAWHATLEFADRFLLTVYDAAYVELAQRRALPLATLDRDIQRAGAQLGLTLLGVD